MSGGREENSIFQPAKNRSNKININSNGNHPKSVRKLALAVFIRRNHSRSKESEKCFQKTARKINRK